MPFLCSVVRRSDAPDMPADLGQTGRAALLGVPLAGVCSDCMRCPGLSGGCAPRTTTGGSRFLACLTGRVSTARPPLLANEGNFAVIDELMGPNFVDHSAPPGVPATTEGAKAFFAMLREAFPDLHATIDDQIAEGDRVVQRTTAHGTMKGDFQGMPVSGKEATWEAIHILRFADGKYVEHWAVTDTLSMLQKLGFAEAPGQPAGAAR
jgi:predicted ester cyclase